MKGYAKVSKNEIPIKAIDEKLKSVNDWVESAKKKVNVIKPKWWQIFREPEYIVENIEEKPDGVRVICDSRFGCHFITTRRISALKVISDLCYASDSDLYLDDSLSLVLKRFKEKQNERY